MKTIKIGSQYEKEVEERLQRQGYKTHRNIKSRFGKQDIFGIGDILATKRNEFLVVACTAGVGGHIGRTEKKIRGIRPHLPKEIKVLYYIKRKNREEIREY